MGVCVIAFFFQSPYSTPSYSAHIEVLWLDVLYCSRLEVCTPKPQSLNRSPPMPSVIPVATMTKEIVYRLVLHDGWTTP